MKWLLKSRSGFTLIELLVVVVITLTIVGTIISFSRIGQSQITMYIEASKVIDIILRAKSLAISAYRDPAISRATCAHGLHLDKAVLPDPDSASFSLDRYLKKEAAFAVPCSQISSSTASVNNYDLLVAESSTYVFSRGIVFDSATNISDIIFRPPDPQILFFDTSGNLMPAGSGLIVIKDKGSGERIQISVGQGGQIAYKFLD